MKRVTQLALFGTLSAVTVAGYWGANVVFDRPGERALKYVPAETTFLFVIDLSPTPSQLLTFKNLESKLGADSWKQPFAFWRQDSKYNPAVSKLVTQYMGRGGVFMRRGEYGKGRMFLLSMNDIEGFQKKMDKILSPSQYKGIKTYPIKDSKDVLGILGDYLVYTDDKELLVKSAEVGSDRSKSILAKPQFMTHMANKPDQTNFSGFFKQYLGDGGWAAMHGGFTETGIKIVSNGWMDPNKEIGKRLSAILPFDSTISQRIPAGSYLSFIVSNLGDLMGPQPALEANSAFENPADADWLKTRAMVSIYPADQANTTGFDVLAIMDDSEGANPAAMLLDGAKTMAKAMTDENAPSDALESKEYRGAKITQFRAEYSEALAESLFGGLRESVVDGNPKMKDAVKWDLVTGGKSFCMAEIGKVGIVSTSDALLQKAIDSYLDKSGDASWTVGNQVGLKIDFNRLATGVSNMVNLAKMESKVRTPMEKIIEMLRSRPESMTLTGQMKPSGDFRVEMFLPLDYSKLYMPK